MEGGMSPAGYARTDDSPPQPVSTSSAQNAGGDQPQALTPRAKERHERVSGAGMSAGVPISHTERARNAEMLGYDMLAYGSFDADDQPMGVMPQDTKLLHADFWNPPDDLAE